jgi:hypothetical protein
MASYEESIFGAISGRHGTAVASKTADGKKLIRMYRVPSNPNTPAQVAQRDKFGFVNAELSPLREIFKVSFRNKKGMNLAVSYALKNAVTNSGQNLSIDYSKLSFAWGSIQLPDQIGASVQTGNAIKIDWDSTLRVEDEIPDELNLVCMNSGSKFTILRESVALRNASTVTLELPEIWEGKEVHCWAYFSTPENNLTSVSTYLGLLQL